MKDLKKMKPLPVHPVGLSARIIRSGVLEFLALALREPVHLGRGENVAAVQNEDGVGGHVLGGVSALARVAELLGALKRHIPLVQRII